MLYDIIMCFERTARLILVSIAMMVLTFARPAHAFIFDSFGDGFWTVINQGNDGNLVVHSSGASQAVATNTAFQHPPCLIR